MTASGRTWVLGFIGFCFLCQAGLGLAGEQPPKEVQELMERASKEASQGNFRAAYPLYRQLAGMPNRELSFYRDALAGVSNCMQQAVIDEKWDDLLVGLVASHAGERAFGIAAAEQLMGTPHHGVVGNGKFHRQPREAIAGTWVGRVEQDRQLALQWLEPFLAAKGETKPGDSTEQGKSELGNLYALAFRLLMMNRQDELGWRLQILTDLATPPDYLSLESDGSEVRRRAPVDGKGDPVLHGMPSEWSQARSDGERVRWLLVQVEEMDASLGSSCRLEWAMFLHSQFSVDTLAQHAWFRRLEEEGSSDRESKLLQLHTLSDDESIAKLANGIRRFSLPAEHNPLKQFLDLVGAKDVEIARRAFGMAFQSYVNRRQLTQAVAFGEKHSNLVVDRSMLEAIVEPRASFDPVGTQLAGRSAKLGMVYRNAKEVEFTADRVDIEKFLSRVKEEMRSPKKDGLPLHQYLDLSHPAQLFAERLEVGDLAKKGVAKWKQALNPHPGHWDRREVVETPLKESGLYIVTAVFDGGAHAERCLFWIQDTSILHTRVGKDQLYVIAKAETGEPMAGVPVELFGYRITDYRGSVPVMETKLLAKKSDDQGMVRLSDEQCDPNFQWTMIARPDKQRVVVERAEQMGYVGEPSQYRELKAYGVSDRPVYRPGETVKGKIWIANASYDPKVTSGAWKSQVCRLDFYNGQGEKVWSHDATTDRFGAVDWEWAIPARAKLGAYFVQVMYGREPNEAGIACNLRFRVEEYRKPEFEVFVEGPKEPVRLGETATATVRAKYYVGSPVSEGEAVVRVERTAYTDHYFPVFPFDWCYGPGYWWCGYDPVWYPGWEKWSRFSRPAPPWMTWLPRSEEPPELVSEQTFTLDGAGEAKIHIDTAVAKAMQGDRDHRYQIRVEIRDRSRRTIEAQGEVLATRKPVALYLWGDRGYFEIGQTMKWTGQARAHGGSEVGSLTGKLRMYRLRFDGAGKPSETMVDEWKVETNPQGQFVQKVEASKSGQYRMEWTLEVKGVEVTTSSMVIIRGEKPSAEGFRYSGLELLPNQTDYRVGETVRLMVNANQVGAHVLVTLRGEEGVHPAPKWITLDGTAKVLEIPVEARDQPNFFVEAITVYGGQVHHEKREIIVPPVTKTLSIETEMDRGEYRPGDAASATVRVRDPEGKPVSGSLALAIYDRSVEAIASDILPMDIREFYWKWRREDGGSRWSYPLLSRRDSGNWLRYPGRKAWHPLGLFGDSMADVGVDNFNDASGGGLTGGGGGRPRFGTGGPGGRVMLGSRMAGGMEMAPAMAMRADMAMEAADGMVLGGMSQSKAGASGGQEDKGVQVRRDFADTALWVGTATTNERGEAKIAFKMPDNLASWKVRTWVVDEQLRVGGQQQESVTRKPLMAKMQMPRFLVEGDVFHVIGLIQNERDLAFEVEASLQVDNAILLGLDAAQATQRVRLEPKSTARVEWVGVAKAEGTVKLRLQVKGEGESDAMEMPLPIVLRGSPRVESFAGTVKRSEGSQSVAFEIPKARRKADSRLTVRVSPSLAMSMVDALPFLVDYPHGCTEQTLNRFLPTVITQRVLQEMKVDLASLAKARTNLNAQELGTAVERRKGLPQGKNPVFDESEVAKMVEAGIDRLATMQNADGGWGWFSGAGEQSWPHTTAVVVRGLLQAQQNDVAIVPDVLERGLQWLERYQQEQLVKLANAASQTQPWKGQVDSMDALVFHILVSQDRVDTTMRDKLYAQRLQLGTYSQGLLGLSMHRLGRKDEAAQLRSNIEERLVQDKSNDTAWLQGGPNRWFWYDSPIEAMAVYLKLLSQVEPQSEQAPRVVKALLNHRRHGSYWDSTRDTALVIEAFAEFLRATKEGSEATTVEVLLDERRIGMVEFTPSRLFQTDNTIELHGEAIEDGEHRLTVKRVEGGNVYWNAYIETFTQEEEIRPAGLEVTVERRVYVLVPESHELNLATGDGMVQAAKGAHYQRTLVEDGTKIPSGSLLEVELELTSKNHYEYVMVEDPKVAAMEPMETQSGYTWDGNLGAYREFRDQRVYYYVRDLPKGSFLLKYRVRAENLGVYTGLPTMIRGMYAPELVGNSADLDATIVEDAGR